MFKERITDASFEGSNCCSLEKSTLLFGDWVMASDDILYVDEHKWLRKTDGIRIFLPDMQQTIHYLFFRGFLTLLKCVGISQGAKAE